MATNFVSREEFERERKTGDFDYVVIGSSFCAIAFIWQLLLKIPKAKILILERGSYTNSQELSPLALGKEEKNSEKQPWKFSSICEYIKTVRGLNYIFGGRSLYWKAWCPEPTDEELDGWPDEVIESLHEYFPKAKDLLKVHPVNELTDDNGKIFGRLQDYFFKTLESLKSDIRAIHRIEHTPLAVVTSKHKKYGEFQKYSGLEPFMEILKKYENVKVATNCVVQKIRHNENGKATILDTSKGEVILGKAKLILAMSTLPSTTLMLNSFPPSCFPKLMSIGKRFTAHILTVICARVPFNNEKYSMLREAASREPEMASFYIPGGNGIQDFHIQFNAVVVREGVPDDAYDRVRNLLKTPSQDKLMSSKGYIVFKCASLGQLSHHNQDNWFRLNDGADITCNATLQVKANEDDKSLWNTMDEATFEVLESLAPTKGAIEYWNEKEWQKERPPTEKIRLKCVVHPASTMWLGTDESSPVNLDYQFPGVENVYLTGGALWPTGASWNPTCAMTALSMHLADKLAARE